MQPEDGSYHRLDQNLVLGPSQQHDSEVVPMCSYTALVACCATREFGGGPLAELSVRVLVSLDQESWTDVSAERLRVRSAGYVEILCPDLGHSGLSARLRYETNPWTTAVISTGIHRCQRRARSATGNDP